MAKGAVVGTEAPLACALAVKAGGAPTVLSTSILIGVTVGGRADELEERVVERAAPRWAR